MVSCSGKPSAGPADLLFFGGSRLSSLTASSSGAVESPERLTDFRCCLAFRLKVRIFSFSAERRVDWRSLLCVGLRISACRCNLCAQTYSEVITQAKAAVLTAVRVVSNPSLARLLRFHLPPSVPARLVVPELPSVLVLLMDPVH